VTGEPTTVRSILFPSATGAAAALTAAARSAGVHGTLGRMPDTAKEAVLAEIGRVGTGILAMDVSDILGRAWAKTSALRTAAEESHAEPDSEFLVELISHSVSFLHEPSIEIQDGDRPLTTMVLQVVLDIEVRGLLAVVAAGRLTAVRAGAGDFTGKLTVGGRPVAQRRVSLDLPGAVHFGDGFALPSTLVAPAA
jgi:hypothetical protein